MRSLSLTSPKDLQWKDSLTTESPAVRGLLIVVAFLYLTLFLFVPLVAVFGEALKKGLS